MVIEKEKMVVLPIVSTLLSQSLTFEDSLLAWPMVVFAVELSASEETRGKVDFSAIPR